MNFTPGVRMYELDSSSELIPTKGDISASPPITPHVAMDASSSSSSSSFLPESSDGQLWTVPGAISVDYTHSQHSPVYYSPSPSSSASTSPQRPIQVMGSYLSPSKDIDNSSCNDNHNVINADEDRIEHEPLFLSNDNSNIDHTGDIGNESSGSSTNSSPEIQGGHESKNRTVPVSADISSRRKNRGSTIILGRDQLRQYQERAAMIEQEQLEKKNREVSRIREQAAQVHGRLEKRKVSAYKIQKLWREKSSLFLLQKRIKSAASKVICNVVSSYIRSKRRMLTNAAAIIIQKYIRRFIASKLVQSIKKFTIQGKWNESQSHKVFALLLGWRVRKIMKSNAMKFSKNSLSDVYVMLQDIVDDALARDTSLHLSNMSHLVTVENLLLYTAQNGDDNYKISTLSPSRKEHLEAVRKCLSRPSLALNWAIIRGLVKQIVVTKKGIHSTFFFCTGRSSTSSSANSCIWYPFPFPGYWDLGSSVRNVLKHKKHMKVSSSDGSWSSFSPDLSKESPEGVSSLNKDKRSLLRMIKKKGAKRSIVSTSSSPHLVTDGENNSQLISNDDDGRGENLIIQRRSSVSPSDVISALKKKFPSKEEISQMAQNDFIEEHSYSSSTTLEGNFPSASSGIALLDLNPSAPIRQTSKPHLQLSVLGAQNLMAANKSKANRDPLKPDRRPSLRATLFLPKAPSSSSFTSQSPNTYDEQRKYHQCTLDAPAMPTYNPVWTESMYIPLPVPKTLMPKMFSPPSFDPSSNCKDLLAYWGQGHVKIEVLDTERFNGDIHLGEISLLLSSLCNTTFQKSMSSPSAHPNVLEISGSYDLQKGEGSNRVSGRLSLRAYLHLPLKSSLSMHSTPNTGESVTEILRDLPSPPIGDIRDVLNAEGILDEHINKNIAPPNPPELGKNQTTIPKFSISPVKLKSQNSSPDVSGQSNSNETRRSSIMVELSQQLKSITQSIKSGSLPPTPPRGTEKDDDMALKQCQSPDLKKTMTARRLSNTSSASKNNDNDSKIQNEQSGVEKNENRSTIPSTSTVLDSISSKGRKNSSGGKGRAERLSIVSMALDNIMDMQQSIETGAALEAKLNSKLSMLKADQKSDHTSTK